MSALAPNIQGVAKNDTAKVFIEYTDKLHGNDILTGTPTVSEVSRSDVDADLSAPSAASNGFAITSVGLNTTSYINKAGETVAVGKAVVFLINTSSVAVGKYAFKSVAVTNDSAAETLQGFARINVTGR